MLKLYYFGMSKSTSNFLCYWIFVWYKWNISKYYQTIAWFLIKNKLNVPDLFCTMRANYFHRLFSEIDGVNNRRWIRSCVWIALFHVWRVPVLVTLHTPDFCFSWIWHLTESKNKKLKTFIIWEPSCNVVCLTLAHFLPSTAKEDLVLRHPLPPNTFIQLRAIQKIGDILEGGQGGGTICQTNFFYLLKHCL